MSTGFSVLRRACAGIRSALEMVKFSHTIFAMPVALTSMLVAGNGLPSLRTFLLIVAAMVTARTSAMTFNRIADLKYDRLNPRTKGRHLPTGKVGYGSAVAMAVVSGALFIVTCGFINQLAFALSPIALAMVFLYSYTKRFTSFSHLILGLCLGISPVGAWIAVTGGFGLPPFVLTAAVLFWVAGFDTIYSIMDIEFDREQGLLSIASRKGLAGALAWSRVFHLTATGFFLVFGWMTGLGILYFIGVGVVAVLLAMEHIVVARSDLSHRRINTAFFHLNAAVSVVFLVFASFDVLL